MTKEETVAVPSSPEVYEKAKKCAEKIDVTVDGFVAATIEAKVKKVKVWWEREVKGKW